MIRMMWEKVRMNKKLILGTVIGLVVGLALGIFVGVVFIVPNMVRNQVQVSGTVSEAHTGTIKFTNLNQTIVTSASITNGEYSVWLVGGQSYNVVVYLVTGNTVGTYSLYIPSGVATFTANF